MFLSYFVANKEAKATSLIASEDLLSALDEERAALHDTEKLLVASRKEVEQLKADLANLNAQNSSLKVWSRFLSFFFFCSNGLTLYLCPSFFGCSG